MTSNNLRPLSFLIVGGACAALQLGLLFVLAEFAGVGAWSNALAFLASGQVNFLLSTLLTWRDRTSVSWRGTARGLLRFNAVIGVGALANQAIFLGFERAVPYLLAGAIALVMTTLTKYFVADRWVFPRVHPLRPESDPLRS